jgi:hypothetical protein
MRLTLRTLLAYMDDILEPDDAQEIAKKIADSPMATELMHRIRDVMRRLRLGAPSVLDRTAGLDPNTVAEYLDNTLSDAQVPDFEKICLESDVHLAEVASCHRILALVLGEPAEVDPLSRERAYQLAGLSGATPEEETQLGRSVGDGDADGVAPGAAEAVAESGKSRVPDYLREPPPVRGSWRALVGLGAVILVAVVVLALAGRFGGKNHLARLLGTERPPAEEGGARGTESSETTGGPGTSVPASPAEPAEGAASGPAGPTPGKTAPEAAQTLPRGLPREKEARPGGAELKPPALAAPGESLPTKVASGAAKTGPGRQGPGSEVPPAPDVQSPDIPAGPGLKQPGPRETDLAKSLPREGAVGGPTPVRPFGAVGADAGRQPPAGQRSPLPAEKPKPIGHVVAAKEVLLARDPQSRIWRSLAGQADLFPGDKLLALPAFRPVIALGGRFKAQLIDGTLVGLLPPDAQGSAGLAIEYGRIMLKAEEAGGARLRLQLGERTGLVSFPDAESTLAIDARRERVPGADPETQPGPLVADLYAASGKISWQEGMGQEPVVLDAPTRRAWGERPTESNPAQQFPKWVYSDTTSPLDQRGAPILERELSSRRPANLVLRELVDFRLKEVRALAVRSLALLGDFEPLLRALDDPEQKLYWDDCIEQLRAGVTRSPASAAAVRSTMERFYGPQGAGLYAMLWKYGRSLQGPEALQLTDYLDHQTLAFRVLALWNLKSAYGKVPNYRPDEPAVKRQVAIQKWRERLKAMPGLRENPPTRGGTPASRESPPEKGPSEAEEMP